MSIKLCSVGDVMLGENFHHFNRGIIRLYGNNYNRLISDSVAEALSWGDLFLFNMESSLMPDETIKTRNIQNGVYRAPVGALCFFDRIRAIKVANVANNHFGQHGMQAVNYSLDALQQKGIKIIGKDKQPLTIHQANKKINIWGVSLVEDPTYCGGYFKSTYDDLIEALELGRKEENEIRIISIHWGKEYLTLENEQQRHLSGKLSQAGFDLILGHHPHVIQPFKQIGKTRVIYSHGNFIFDQDFSKITRRGLIFQYDFFNETENLLFSYQHRHQIHHVKHTSSENLLNYCTRKYHRHMPFYMRILMKVEMVIHFYTLNRSILETFGKRFFFGSNSKRS
ncbi:hypothetical protein MASR1M74_21490 [Lentimicrobium sp.]